MTSPYEKFEKNIGYHFKKRHLLEVVFTHRSYLNEHRLARLEHNERLEFLGDAVLELAVTDYLYSHYPNPEGELTSWRSALVRGTALYEIADKIDLEKYLKMSRGESKATGKSRSLIMANALEALIGAIYLDGGMKCAEKFVRANLLNLSREILNNDDHHNYKSMLLEHTQAKLSIQPSYRVLSEEGPDHQKTYHIEVTVSDKPLGEGVGHSKKRAEQRAAKAALEKLGVPLDPWQ